MKKQTLLFVLMIFSSIVMSQTIELVAPITMPGQQPSRAYFGLETGATSSVDQLFGEQNLIGQPVQPDIDLRILQRVSDSLDCGQTLFNLAPNPQNLEMHKDYRSKTSTQMSDYVFYVKSNSQTLSSLVIKGSEPLYMFLDSVKAMTQDCFDPFIVTFPCGPSAGDNWLIDIGLGGFYAFAFYFKNNLSAAHDLSLQQEMVSVVPNPAQETIELQHIECAPCRVSVFDLIGTLVYENKAYQTPEQISLPTGMSAGLYFVQITEKGRNTRSVPFIHSD
jgi:Secretion system C-terminal sorting domain